MCLIILGMKRGRFIQKSPHILSNVTALLSLFLEYA